MTATVEPGLTPSMDNAEARRLTRSASVAYVKRMRSA